MNDVEIFFLINGELELIFNSQNNDNGSQNPIILKYITVIIFTFKILFNFYDIFQKDN